MLICTEQVFCKDFKILGSNSNKHNFKANEFLLIKSNFKANEFLLIKRDKRTFNKNQCPQQLI